MSLLDDRELRGVIAHELGHVGNRDILIGSIAAMLAAAIAWITRAMMFGMMFGGAATTRTRCSRFSPSC